MKRPHHILPIGLTALALILTGCNTGSSDGEASEHLSRAKVYADQGQYRSATLEIRNAIQVAPGNVEHILELARLYNEMGAHAPASDLLAPWQAEYGEAVALELASSYLSQNKHISAREALALAQPDTPEEEIRKAYLEAEVLRQSGKLDQAVQSYRAILNENPKHQDATAGLAKALIESNQALAALELLQQWREANGDTSELLYLQGLAHYRLNELENATNTLTDGLAALPTSDVFLPVRRQTLSLLSRALTEQGKFTQAQAYNQILAENSNTELRKSTEVALDAISSGDLTTARTTLEDLVQQNPDNELIAMLLGAVNLQQGNLSEGEALLAENLDAETTPTPFIRLATMAQIDKGKRDHALATLERSLLARPTDVELLAMHGILALTLPEKANEGIVSLNKALQIDNERVRLRMALAQYYAQHGQTEQALGQLRSAFAQKPTDWPVTNYYVALLLNNNLTSEAEEVRNTLASDHSEEPYGNVLAGMIDHRLGNTDQALSRLKTQVQKTPEWAPPHLAMASIHQSKGDRQATIASLLEAAKRNTASIGPLEQAGKLYAAQHKPDEVVDWLAKVGSDTPTLAPQAAALAAQIRVQQGRPQEARDILAGHLDSQSRFVERAHLQLLSAEAQQAARQQNWEAARAKAAEIISLQPDNVNSHLLLSRIEISAGAYSDATQLLADVEDKFGLTPPVALTRALLIRQSDSDTAAFEYLLSQWNTNPQPLLAPELIRLAQVTGAGDARQLATQWTEQAPNQGPAWATLAGVVLNQGDESAAIEHYQQALRYQPNNLTALNNLAWLLKDDRPSEALTYSSRAYQLQPNSPAVMDTHGWVLYLNGQKGDALTLLRQANKMAPDNTEIADHLKTVEAQSQ